MGETEMFESEFAKTEYIEKDIVEWGFSYFLPELKKTGCTVWGFILPEVSDIEGETDLWTKEIEKNFRVIRATSYEAVIEQAASE